MILTGRCAGEPHFLLVDEPTGGPDEPIARKPNSRWLRSGPGCLCASEPEPCLGQGASQGAREPGRQEGASHTVPVRQPARLDVHCLAGWSTKHHASTDLQCACHQWAPALEATACQCQPEHSSQVGRPAPAHSLLPAERTGGQSLSTLSLPHTRIRVVAEQRRRQLRSIMNRVS